MALSRFLFVLVMCGLFAGCASVPDNKPRIYDTTANGQAQFDSALKQARTENKRVLLNLGANWCGDSQGMYQLLSTNTEIRTLIQDRYVLTLVDVNKRGLRDRNSSLLKRINNPVTRIPVLLIVDSAGNVLNDDAAERLLDSDHQHPERVLAYLRKWSGN